MNAEIRWHTKSNCLQDYPYRIAMRLFVFILIVAVCTGQGVNKTFAYQLGTYDFGAYNLILKVGLSVNAEGDSAFTTQIERKDLDKTLMFDLSQFYTVLSGYHLIDEEPPPKIKNKLMPFFSKYKYESGFNKAYIEKVFSGDQYVWWKISNGKESLTIKNQKTMLRMLNKANETIDTLQSK